MDNSASMHSSEVFKAKKALNQAEKRIAELDRMFSRLYEDNVSGKISDEHFTVLSAGYDNEQKQLKVTVTKLTAFIEASEQKSADVTAFINVVQKYEHITELTPEILLKRSSFTLQIRAMGIVFSMSRYTSALMWLSLWR